MPVLQLFCIFESKIFRVGHFPGMIVVRRLTHSPGLSRPGQRSTFMLVVSKALKGFQRISSGKIQPAA